MISVGLTGGLGSGKTTVLKMFKRLGAYVVSADDLVHEELKRNKSLKNKIRAYFGLKVFRKGKILKTALAREVFSSPKGLKRLNSLIHPLVASRLLDLFRRYKDEPMVVAEIPLLFEAGFDKFFDVTIGVATDPKILKARLFKNSKRRQKDIELRMRRQLPPDKKIARCDFVIDNSKDKKTTNGQVKRLMEVILWKSSK